jgi:hypothetical protein
MIIKYGISFLLGMMFIIILDMAWASQAYAHDCEKPSSNAGYKWSRHPILESK